MMEEILTTLHSQHKSQEVLLACKRALCELKQIKSQNKSSFNEDYIGNCFMMVFISNLTNMEVLPAVVDVLVELVKVFPNSTSQFGKKGIFHNIVTLLPTEQSFNADDKIVVLCIYKLVTALTEKCPENLSRFVESGMIQLIRLTFCTCRQEKEIMTFCLQFLSILIGCNMKEDKEDETGFKKSWRHHFYMEKIGSVPVAFCILSAMNQFIKGAPRLQLFGIQCLHSITLEDGGTMQIHDNGALDTVLHACSYYEDNVDVQLQAFSLVADIMEALSYSDFYLKTKQVCEVVSVALSKFTGNSEVVTAVCKTLKVLLVKGSNISQDLFASNIPDSIFLAMASGLYKRLKIVMNSDPAYTALSEIIYMMVADTTNDIRNDILMNACENSNVGLAVCMLYLGANVNYNSNDQKTVLTAALENKDETSVKQIIGLISTFQHVGLWKARIEAIAPCFKIILSDSESRFISPMLWYLLDRDLNGVAEWSKLGLTILKTEWLEVAFASVTKKNQKENHEKSLAFLSQSKWFLLGESIVSISLDKDDDPGGEAKRSLQSRFSGFTNAGYVDKKCPLQQIRLLVDDREAKPTPLSSLSEEDDYDSEVSDDYICPHCSCSMAFRDALHLSFDEDTFWEEKLHKNPVEQCTCHVDFPPGHLSSSTVKAIQLSHNSLQTIECFANLSENVKKCLSESVKRLNLLDNQLTEFPSPVAQIFFSVVDVNLSKNQLKQFPFEILKFCPHLETLDLTDNKIVDSIPITSSLTGFSRHSSHVVLPDEFSHVLKTLKLANNSLEAFPNWLLQICPELTHLNLNRNFIKALIIQETFRNNDDVTFEPVPSKLEHLDVSENEISILPSSFIACLPNLLHWNMSQNKLTQVNTGRKEQLQCSKLKHLDMSNNKLCEVPGFVTHLRKLEVLLLSNNLIEEIHADVSWNAKGLMHLDVSSNQISDVLPLVNLLEKRWCSTLKKLDLSKNLFLSLPPCIGRLTSLEVLDISSNKLDSLPDELGQLSNLTTFVIEGNPLDMEDSIINGRAQEIRQFLYARLKKAVPQNRVKLMLVGDPGAGKTTFLKSLIKQNRRRKISTTRFSEVISGVGETKSQPTLATVGIDVVEVDLIQGNKVYHLSVWDFAGQEDFYATHPCFISERAMYVALYDSSKDLSQLHALKPWLTAIHARASHCPVLIVGSHADLLPRNREARFNSLKHELQQMSKQKWFPKGLIHHELQDVRENSSGIILLKSKIADLIEKAVIHNKPLVGNMVPSCYVELSDLLKREANSRADFPVITFNELVSLVREHSLSHEFESGSELMTAIKYLHQTGFLLHFDEPRSRLRDCFFIKPAWLCKLLAQVVTMKHDNNFKVSPYINKEGILSRNLFSRNFVSQSSANALPETFLPRLFRLLENFEIVLGQGGDNYLVPSQLPAAKPKIELPVRWPSSKLIRYFSLEYLPMGLWPRLTARLLTFADKLLHGYTAASTSSQNAPPTEIVRWKNGLYFLWEKSNEKVFILVQSGSAEYDAATNTSQLSSSGEVSDGGFEEVTWTPSSAERAGLEVIVPRSPSGQILLAQLVDHIVGLIDEWYPGLLNLDRWGTSLFQQYSPCFICQEIAMDESSEVLSFCIEELAQSVLCNKMASPLSEEKPYDVKISASGVILITCPQHKTTPVPLAWLAPEINLDDFEASLRLDPNLLDFNADSRQKLGGGGFGAVYQATYDNEDIAIKTFYANTADMSYKMLRDELNVLAKHHHPSIIALKGFIPPAYSTPNLPLPLLALEYAKLGSLGKLLSNMSKLPVHARRSALSPSVKHRIALEIACGVCFLHTQNIVYRDLKPDNVLLMSLDLSSPTIAKITDYGISTLASPYGIPAASGSPGYSAPEVVNLKAAGKGRHDFFPYSVKCDLYSYGLVLHELAVGRSPWIEYVHEKQLSENFASNSSEQPDDIILKGILPSPLSEYEGATCWLHAEELIKKCLGHNPEDRPSACQIVTILSNIQSSCLRLSISLLHADHPVLATIYRSSYKNAGKLLRHASVSEDKMLGDNDASCRAEIFYFDSNSKQSFGERQSCSVMRACIDVVKGVVLSDDVFTAFDDEMEISSMMCVSDSAVPRKLIEKQELIRRSSMKYPSLSEQTIVTGTKQGHVLLVSAGHYVVKEKFDVGVTSIHFHRLHEQKSPSQMRESCYVLVALADCTLHVYTGEQIANDYSKQPLHTLDLSNVSSIPVHGMRSAGNAIYALCGKQIVLLTMADSSRPEVKGSVQESYFVAFDSSPSSFYASVEDSNTISVWHNGDIFRKNSIRVYDALSQKSSSRSLPSVSVTSIFVESQYSSLWVGLSGGQVIVYSEPRLDALALLHRHTGPVGQIFCVRGSDSDVVVCSGVGTRSVADELKDSTNDCVECTEVDGASSRRTPRQSSLYLSVWDADLPSKAISLQSTLNARKKLA